MAVGKVLIKTMLFVAIGVFVKASNAYAITIVGDFNKDNIVDIKDVAQMASYYESNNTSYDLNNDGIVDIFDITKASKNMSSANFKVYDSNGLLAGQYDSGHLIDAASKAANVNGEAIVNGQVVWDKNYYYVFDGENYISKSGGYFNSNIAATALNNGLVIDKNGIPVLNRNTGYKIKLGYAQDDLNLRNQPSPTASYDSEIPKGSLIEIVKRTNGVYQVKYNNGTQIKTGYVTKYVDIFTDDFNNSALGFISEKYESNGDPGAISNNAGDAGGASYGAFQLSSNMGSVDSFLMWLKNVNGSFYNTLMNARQADNNTYGTNFNNAWTNLAQTNYDAFYQVQKDYIKSAYYDQLVQALSNSGVDYTSRLNDFSVRNMLWSTAVQHGVTGAKNIVQKYSGITNDSDFVNDIYDERSKVDIYFPNCSDAIKQSVINRFISERAFVLRVLNDEKSY